MINWIAANNLVRNIDKTNIMKKCKNYEYNEIHNKEFITFYVTFGYKEMYIEDIVNTDFLVYKLITT